MGTCHQPSGTCDRTTAATTSPATVPSARSRAREKTEPEVGLEDEGDGQGDPVGARDGDQGDQGLGDADADRQTYAVAPGVGGQDDVAGGAGRADAEGGGAAQAVVDAPGSTSGAVTTSAVWRSAWSTARAVSVVGRGGSGVAVPRPSPRTRPGGAVPAGSAGERAGRQVGRGAASITGVIAFNRASSRVSSGLRPWWRARRARIRSYDSLRDWVTARRASSYSSARSVPATVREAGDRAVGGGDGGPFGDARAQWPGQQGEDEDQEAAAGHQGRGQPPGGGQREARADHAVQQEQQAGDGGHRADRGDHPGDQGDAGDGGHRVPAVAVHQGAQGHADRAEELGDGDVEDAHPVGVGGVADDAGQGAHGGEGAVGGRPAARPIARGRARATAARAAAAQLTGACWGVRFRTSQSGGGEADGELS